MWHVGYCYQFFEESEVWNKGYCNNYFGVKCVWNVGCSNLHVSTDYIVSPFGII